jgi:hypothetical protein
LVSALKKSLSFTTEVIDEVRSSIHTYNHREVFAEEAIQEFQDKNSGYSGIIFNNLKDSVEELMKEGGCFYRS